MKVFFENNRNCSVTLCNEDDGMYDAPTTFEDINADYMMSYPLLPKMTANTRAFHKEVPELLLVPNTDFLPCVRDAFYDRYGSLSAYFEAIGMSDDEFVAAVCTLLKFSDGSMIAIDTIAVENEISDNMYQRSELDYLIYNDSVAYAELILNGDPETYLKTVTEYKPLDS